MIGLTACNGPDRFSISNLIIDNNSSNDVIFSSESKFEDQNIPREKLLKTNLGDCCYLFDFALLDAATRDTLFAFQEREVTPTGDVEINDITRFKLIDTESYSDGSLMSADYLFVLTDEVIERWRSENTSRDCGSQGY